jgi:trimethylamine--corrinoid protein Co-methyltransferase
MVKRMLRPIVVNPETIMLDLIEQIGPEGNFIGEYRSSSICRQEIWVPTLMDRNPHSVWEKKGSLSIEQRTVERLRAILQKQQPAPLPESVSQEISSILTGV